jgi:mutator protein MutT
MTQITVAIAVIVRAGELLIAQRKPTGPLADYWEFPGGKCEPGETIESCLHREIKEEIDVDIEILRPLDVLHHTYPHGQLAIHPFYCRITAGTPRPVACQQILWIKPNQLRNYRFPPANDDLLKSIVQAPLPQSIQPE